MKRIVKIALQWWAEESTKVERPRSHSVSKDRVNFHPELKLCDRKSGSLCRITEVIFKEN